MDARAMQRRLRFSLLIMVLQILLVSLAISWLVHMIIIAGYGSAYFVENNHLILWAEIIAKILRGTAGSLKGLVSTIAIRRHPSFCYSPPFMTQKVV